MPRRISFAKTVEAVRNREKTVTRRDGWRGLEAGTLLKPVEKLYGGDPIFENTLIRVTGVRLEPLEAITDYDRECTYCAGNGVFRNVVDPRRYDRHDSAVRKRHGEDLDCILCGGYGTKNLEVAREGFGVHYDALNGSEFDGREFVERFCAAIGVDPDDEITRIEFEYFDPSEE